MSGASPSPKPAIQRPEAIVIRQHADGARELVGGWPELTELSHDLLTGGQPVVQFNGRRRLDVVVNDEQRQAYRLVAMYWTAESALFIREDLAVDG